MKVTERVSSLISSYIRIMRSNRNTVIIPVTLFLSFSSFLSWFFVLPLYLRHLGATDEEIGIAYVAFDIAICLLQFPGGFIADRIGRKKLITIPTFIVPMLYFIAANSSSWKVVVSMVTLANLLTGLQIPALLSMVGESVDEKDRGLAYGLFSMSVSGSFAFGPGVGSIFVKNGDYVGIRHLIMASVPITLICAFVRWFLLKDVAKHEEFRVKLKDVISAVNIDLILCFFAMVFFTFVVNITVYGPFTVLYARDIIKMGESSIQQMIMMGGIAALFFGLISGKVTQKIGSRKALIFGSLGHTLIFIPWLYSKTPYHAMMLYVPAYLFLQLSYIGHDTILSDLTEIKTRSSIIGLFGMLPGLLGAFAPMTGTFIAQALSPKAPFYFALLFAALTTIYLIPIRSRKI